MNNFITDLKYRLSIVKFANRFGVTRAADHFNVSRSFIYKLLSRFDGTLGSLKPFSKRPMSHPNQTTPDEYDLIKNYCRRNPNTGLVILWLKLRKGGYTRSLTTLYRCLLRLGIRTNPPKKPKYKPKLYEPMTFPGERVQIDVKMVPKECLVGSLNNDEEKYYQYTCIDEYSRYRYIEIFREKSTYSSKCFLLNCIKKMPFDIKCVQTDNGLEFTNQIVHPGAGPTLFEKELKRLGIQYKRIKPYTPRHNGKVERSHGKDQLYFYNGRTFFSLTDLETQVARRMYEYNRFPMKPLGWLSPIEFLDNYNRTH
jgi:transposase